MAPNAAERLHSFLLHDYNYYKHRASVVEKSARVAFQMKDVVMFDARWTVSYSDIFLQPNLH